MCHQAYRDEPDTVPGRGREETGKHNGEEVTRAVQPADWLGFTEVAWELRIRDAVHLQKKDRKASGESRGWCRAQWVRALP